ALPTNATDTTSLSTYLYARANPLTYTDPDGRAPGWAIIDWTGTHARITTHNPATGESVTSHLTYELGSDENAVVELNPRDRPNSSSKSRSFRVEIPNIEESQNFQENMAEYGKAGRYTEGVKGCNNCVTHLGDVLRVGGVEGVPESAGEIGSWVQKNGTRVQRGGFGTNGELDILILAGQILYDAEKRNWANDRARELAPSVDIANFYLDWANIQQGKNPSTGVVMWSAPGPGTSGGEQELRWTSLAEYFTGSTGIYRRYGQIYGKLPEPPQPPGAGAGSRSGN
ncbi:hypothetical protein ACIBBG_33340, partial [Micromonospora chersina]|uniref:hypothetical protein n=1 Tax=Micromonospora chersina TaxID=47854 RepID=UPI003797FFEB